MVIRTPGAKGVASGKPCRCARRDQRERQKAETQSRQQKGCWVAFFVLVCALATPFSPRIKYHLCGLSLSHFFENKVRVQQAKVLFAPGNKKNGEKPSEARKVFFRPQQQSSWVLVHSSVTLHFLSFFSTLPSSLATFLIYSFLQLKPSSPSIVHPAGPFFSPSHCSLRWSGAAPRRHQ